MLPFVRSDLSAERAIQRIAWATLHDCPPIGTATEALEENDRSFNPPKRNARQERGHFSMDAPHEWAYLTRIAREGDGPTGAKDV